MLSAYLKSLRDKGEKLAIQELEPPHQPAQGCYLFASLAAISNRFSSGNQDYELPNRWGPAAPGRVYANSRLESWITWSNKTNTWQGVGQLFSPQSNRIVAIERALECPGLDLDINYLAHGLQTPWDDKYLRAVREVQLLRIVALFELQRTNLAAVHRHILGILRFGDALESSRMIHLQQSRQGRLCVGIELIWEALLAPGWREAQLAEFQYACSRPDVLESMSQSLEMERTAMFKTLQEIARSPKDLSGSLNGLCHDGNCGWQRPNERIWAALTPIQGWLWKHVWKDQDLCLYLKRWERSIERSRLAAKESWQSLGSTDPEKDYFYAEYSAVEETTAWTRFRFPFSQRFRIPNDLLIRQALVTNVRQQLASIVLASHRYRLAHGDWPQSAQDLVPRYLAVVPHDPLTGAALVLRHNADRGLLVYSLGFDGVDDGGDPSSISPKDHRKDFSDGKDLVWPQPATAEDIATAFKEEQWDAQRRQRAETILTPQVRAKYGLPPLKVD
jgi:hypothetical protein